MRPEQESWEVASHLGSHGVGAPASGVFLWAVGPGERS